MTLALKNTLIFTTVMALAGTAGFIVQRQLATHHGDKNSMTGIQSTEQLHQLRPEFAMKDIDGKIRNIKEWDGQVILLNFWATWCPPCMKEIPEFIALQNKYGAQGFQIIGVAIDDEALVKDFALEAKINYPIMASEFEAIELSQRYGNKIGGLPYSVIINRNGEISNMITGELSTIKAEKILKELGLDV